MADTWQWNDFIEVLSGDELRHYAQEHNVFIYPYDIFTSSDIAMFKNVKVKDPKNRFIVCALNDMNEKDTKEGKVIYEIEPWVRMCEWESCAADSYEGAIARWNKRMKKTAAKMMKPPLRRFVALESSSMVTKFPVKSCAAGLVSAPIDSMKPFMKKLCASVRNCGSCVKTAFLFICYGGGENCNPLLLRR